MCITEYDKEQTLAQEREEGRKEGIEEGKKEGMEIGLKQGTLLTLADLVQDGLLTFAQAAKKAKMTEKEFKAKVAELQSEALLV